MLSGIIELAKQVGQPAIYLVLSLLMLVWGAKSYIDIRRTMARDYRESVLETLKVVKRLESEAAQNQEFEPIKKELLRSLGAVDSRLTSADQYIAHDSSSLNAFLSPEPMLAMGAAGAFVMVVTNTFGYLVDAPRAHLALILSFIMALGVFALRRSWLTRILYYVLVAIAIYAVAAGLNNLGVNLTH